MIRNCLRSSNELLINGSLLKVREHSKFLNLSRNFNITSSEHIKKIGDHLLTNQNYNQPIILNLPFENDFLLPKYLIENGQQNLLLILKKTYQNYAEVLNDVLNSNQKLNLKAIENVNLLNLKINHTVKKDSDLTIYSEILKNVHKKKWSSNELAGKLFMVVPHNSKMILRSFIGQVVHLSHFFSNGRIELYLLIPVNEYNKMKEETTSSLFFAYSYKVLFDFELLDKFEWSDLKMTHNKRLFEPNKTNKYCYLVKLTPKKSLTTDYSPGYLSSFINLLVKLNPARNSLIISSLEIYFPGIGIKIIDLGYSVFTKFGELKLEDFLKIFDLIMKDEKDAFIEMFENDHH